MLSRGTSMAENAATNPFWDYSLNVYHGRVVTLCLELQDDCGMDINLLLYAAWLAHRGRLLTAEHLATQEAAVSDWRARAVQPLRELRRNLRDFAPAATLREKLAELELSAERTEQDILYAGSVEAAVSGVRQGDAGVSQFRAQLALVAAAGGGEKALWEPRVDVLASLLASAGPGVAPRSSG